MNSVEMQKKLDVFLNLLYYASPLVALYDVPDITPFAPHIYPPEEGKGHSCIAAYYPSWVKGKTLVLTKERYGCGGAAHYLCGKELMRSRGEFIDFLYDEEGLRASKEIMGKWVDQMQGYIPKNQYILLGPFRAEQVANMVSVTFYPDPDRLSALIHAANYRSESPTDDVVVAPMASACKHLTAFLQYPQPEKPRAVIGATDMAMRRFLPVCELAFTVNMPMFYQMIEVDKNHFLHKSFWDSVVKARKWKHKG
jgi:hypothetical protein